MRTLPEKFFAWIALSALLAAAAPAHAWGPEGHAIVAEIALNHLNTDARQSFEQLLGNTDLASASIWPDLVRSALPVTAPWHYVDIPSTANGYLASRDCPQGNCVVEKIRWFSQILRDPAQNAAARRLALIFLIHFVGDIHQPFHVFGDARGGNDIPVSLFGSQQCGTYTCTMHFVWDTGLIQHTRLNDRQYVDFLEKNTIDGHLDPGPEDPEAWADESFKLAEKALVKPGTNIDQSYYDLERPVVDRQLALAGLRLARVLNEDLAPSLGSSTLAPP